MEAPHDWVDLDRLKSHLHFYRDENGNFVATDQDDTLSDCIAAAVRWCSSHTGLPLVRQTLTVPTAPPGGLDQPLCLPRIVSPVSVAAVRHWPTERRDVDGTVEAPVGRMETMGASARRDPYIRVWPPSGGAWSSLGAGGWEVDVVKDVLATDVPGDALTMAIIQVARDFFDAGAVKERKSAAEHLLRGYRYMGTGL